MGTDSLVMQTSACALRRSPLAGAHSRVWMDGLSNINDKILGATDIRERRDCVRELPVGG